MTWEQRYRLAHVTRISLVPAAVLGLIAAIVFALFLRWLGPQADWDLFRYGPDGARAVLGTLAGSMLTFLVFVLSATLIVVQLASAQLSPRVITLVLTRPGLKIALGVLTFTYTFTLAALARVEGEVPSLRVEIAIVLNLISIVVFFLFVQKLAYGLRPASLLQHVGERARGVIGHVYPTVYDPSKPEEPVSGVLPPAPTATIEFDGRPGVVMAFSVANLVRLARDANAVVELVPQVGDCIASGDPLFRVYGGDKPITSAAALRGCVAIGIERTLEQDPRFGFRILVDIANKALSPAINDPTTAVLALDQLDHLLHDIGRRRLDEGQARDAGGSLRLVYGTPDWPDYVMLAVTEIRHYGVGSVQVGRRLRAMLEHLIEILPEDRQPPLEEELTLLVSAVQRGFSDEVDRKRAGVGDHQGVGGSDS